MESITLTILLPASAEQIYKAWMDSEQHALFTGGEAEIEPFTGGSFTAWDGYIEGVTLQLEPYHRIVQSWRSSEFPSGSQDSQIEILLEERGKQTEFILIHTNIPLGQGQKYKDGWAESYFEPMHDYFSEL